MAQNVPIAQLVVLEHPLSEWEVVGLIKKLLLFSLFFIAKLPPTILFWANLPPKMLFLTDKLPYSMLSLGPSCSPLQERYTNYFSTF